MVSHVTTFSEKKLKEHVDTIICSFIPMGNPASLHFQKNLQARATQILGMVNKATIPGVQLLKFKFQTGNLQISGDTTQNFVTCVTWHPRSVHSSA
jgi:hypothetical protein